MLPYACKDVASDPPTTVIIVGPTKMLQCNTGDTVFAIGEENVEPTQGWLHRDGKPHMTICFMHSFGKCSGRNGTDPSTCFQVHVKVDVLAALRSQYVHQPLPLFTRIVHAQLTDNLRSIISISTKKEFKMQYLDYKVHDVAVTSGFHRYEAAYRRWLFSTDNNREGIMTDNKVFQCDDFALSGVCPNGNECTGIHALLSTAQVRDHAVAKTLTKLTHSWQPTATSSIGTGTSSSVVHGTPTSTPALRNPNSASDG